MELLLGKPIAEKLLRKLGEDIHASHIKPGLAVILIGDDPASHLYVGLKEKAAREIGMYFERHFFSTTDTEENIVETVHTLNQNAGIHGIIVQLPLPNGFDENRIIEGILPEKDADGFHPTTLEHYFSGDESSQPVFPRAVSRLIQSSGQSVAGEKGVVLVNSELFGRVMMKTLELLGIRTEIFQYKKWETERGKLKGAKVIVTACGVPRLIRSEHLSSGSIIIDGGITRVGDKIFGDVDIVSARDLSGWIAPVPGGVGPLTVASLLERVVDRALHP